MLEVVGAIEAVAEDPAYQDAALSGDPAIAHQAFGPRGVGIAFDELSPAMGWK